MTARALARRLGPSGYWRVIGRVARWSTRLNTARTVPALEVAAVRLTFWSAVASAMRLDATMPQRTA